MFPCKAIFLLWKKNWLGYTARNAMKNGPIQNTVCLVCTENSTGINGAGLDGTVCARSHEQPKPQTFTGSVCACIFLIVQSVFYYAQAQ